MIQLAYLSATPTRLTAVEIADILATSRRNNQRRGITGLLLYKDRNVLQVLEGERKDVLELLAVIEKDPRHHGVVRLYEKEITGREFSAWTMGFRDLEAAEVRQLEGFSEFLDPGFNLGTVNPTDAGRLMSIFRSAF